MNARAAVPAASEKVSIKGFDVKTLTTANPHKMDYRFEIATDHGPIVLGFRLAAADNYHHDGKLHAYQPPTAEFLGLAETAAMAERIHARANVTVHARDAQMAAALNNGHKDLLEIIAKQFEDDATYFGFGLASGLKDDFRIVIAECASRFVYQRGNPAVLRANSAPVATLEA